MAWEDALRLVTRVARHAERLNILINRVPALGLVDEEAEDLREARKALSAAVKALRRLLGRRHGFLAS